MQEEEIINVVICGAHGKISHLDFYIRSRTWLNESVQNSNKVALDQKNFSVEPSKILFVWMHFHCLCLEIPENY